MEYIHIQLSILLFFFTFSCFSAIIHAQSCITGDVACTSGEQYCRSDGKCATLKYNPVVKVKGKPASNGKSAFHLLVFSDVQFDFLICKQAPLAECIYHDFDGPRPRRRALLQAAASRQAQCVTQLSTELPDMKAVLHNGDITNRGLPDEVSQIEAFHDNLQATLNVKQPLMIALGNHDYFLGDEAASVRVISYYEAALRGFAKRTRLRNIDYNTTGIVYNAFAKRNESYSRGSLCFSIEFNKYVFVVLHWAVSQRTGEYDAKFAADDTRQGAFHQIDITPLTDWLSEELASAKKKKRKVILIPHAWKGLRRLTERRPEVMDVLHDSTLIAVISGHVHDAYGFDNSWKIGFGDKTRTIPVYYAGSTSYEKMIALSLKARKKGLSVQVYDTKTTPCVKTMNTSTQWD